MCAKKSQQCQKDRLLSFYWSWKILPITVPHPSSKTSESNNCWTFSCSELITCFCQKFLNVLLKVSECKPYKSLTFQAIQ